MLTVLCCCWMGLFWAQEPTTSARSGLWVDWDSTTVTRLSPAGTAGSYPRMIALANGVLLAAYASRGNVVVTQSRDAGKTWSTPVVAAAQCNEVNMDTPELLQLQNGAILLCYGTRPRAALQRRPDSTKRFEIRVQQSRNGGATWENEAVLYRAGSSFDNGCWEPAAVQLPNGEIQLFFANEAPYTESNEQNISLLRSLDNGLTWSDAPQVVAFRKGSRDGMPVPLWLQKEKKVVVAMEDPGYKNFKPYLLQSAANGQWPRVIDGKDKDRWYALKEPITDTVYAGAPHLRQLSTGETILSYQSTEGRKVNRDRNAVMRVAVGDRHAKNFINVTTPFTVPEGFSALWNGLCVLKDDTIVAVTSTNGFSKAAPEIWMIKGKLVRHQKK